MRSFYFNEVQFIKFFTSIAFGTILLKKLPIPFAPELGNDVMVAVIYGVCLWAPWSVLFTCVSILQWHCAVLVTRAHGESRGSSLEHVPSALTFAALCPVIVLSLLPGFLCE